MLDNQDNLNSFLWYGYVIGATIIPAEMIPPAPDDPLPEELPELIRLGSSVFMDVLMREIQGCRSLAVPLSGGVDSRVLLAGICTHRDAASISTFTFGVPGALDFELGNRVAREYGTRHRSMNLSRYEYSWDGLLDVSRRMGGTICPFQHAPVCWIREFIGDAVIVSGYLGDVTAGSHVSRQPENTWSGASRRFARLKRYAAGWNLTAPDFNPVQVLPQNPLLPPDRISYDDQLDMAVHQQQYIRHAVLIQGFEYRTPFLNPRWLQFMMNVPHRLRLGQTLYFDLLAELFPRAFRIPVKNRYGLNIQCSSSRFLLQRAGHRLKRYWNRYVSRTGPDPLTNYIDFDDGIRHMDSLRQVVTEAVSSLHQRNVIHWMDGRELLNAHLAGRVNAADALTLLASVEIMIRQGES